MGVILVTGTARFVTHAGQSPDTVGTGIVYPGDRTGWRYACNGAVRLSDGPVECIVGGGLHHASGIGSGQLIARKVIGIGGRTAVLRDFLRNIAECISGVTGRNPFGIGHLRNLIKYIVRLQGLAAQRVVSLDQPIERIKLIGGCMQ